MMIKISTWAWMLAALVDLEIDSWLGKTSGSPIRIPDDRVSPPSLIWPTNLLKICNRMVRLAIYRKLIIPMIRALILIHNKLSAIIGLIGFHYVMQLSVSEWQLL